MRNKFARDDAMKTWMTNPTSYDDQAGVAKGFELDSASKEAAAEEKGDAAAEGKGESAAVQLWGSGDEAGPANQADKSFQVAIK